MPIPQAAARYIIPDLPTTDELLPFLRRVDENQWYSNFGPLVHEFEHTFMATMGAAHGATPQYGFAAMTGYHALAIGLKLLGCGPGSQVLMPAITFPACPLAAQHIGADPVLADVDNKSWLLTPAIARAIAAKTKIDAVMPVAIYGIPLPTAEWDAFSKDTGIPVIIDAAAAVESQRYLQKGIVVHSLHALKPFGIGEGGLLVAADPHIIEAAREYANFGMRDRIGYTAGENAKMSEYHAAVALAQLQRWPAIKERRRRVFGMFQTALRGAEAKATIHPELDQAIVSCLMLRTVKPNAQGLLTKIKNRGVFAHRTYFPPLYEHPYYHNLAVASGDGRISQTSDMQTKIKFMTNCEALNQCVIGLPFHAYMQEEEVRNATLALITSLSG